MPAITLLPTPAPARTMPAEEYVPAADAVMGALPQLVADINAAVTAMNNNSTNSTSTTSLTIGTGTKSLTVETGKSYVPGQPIRIASTVSPTNWMTGDVTTYNPVTGALVAEVSWANGTGTLAAWTVSLSPIFLGGNAFGLFYKTDSTSVAFTKTAAGTLSIKAGTHCNVAGSLVSFAAATAVTMPTLTAGTDYAIYVCADGTVRADASFAAPSGYTTANSRKIGGFHYGLTPPGTTVAGGSFATTGNGMIWTQPDVDKIAGIDEWSLWDLKYRPACPDPRGFTRVGAGGFWMGVYICSTDPDVNGLSKYNTNIASGTVLPKIPAEFGGNGTVTYPSLNWWVANEIARSKGCYLPSAEQAAMAFFGVTENQSIDATASTYPTTQRNAGYTSKYGIEQASGHHWIWGSDSSAFQDVTSAGSWKQVNGNTGAAGSQRGEIYTFGTYGLVRVILGGSRAVGANSGSRASDWNNHPWNSYWGLGLRAACDHLQLD